MTAAKMNEQVRNKPDTASSVWSLPLILLEKSGQEENCCEALLLRMKAGLLLSFWIKNRQFVATRFTKGDIDERVITKITQY
jgi:hypothetical protein